MLGFEDEDYEFTFDRLSTIRLFDYVAGKSVFNSNSHYEDKIYIQEPYDYFKIIENTDYTLSEIESLLLNINQDSKYKNKETKTITNDNILQTIDLYDIWWEGDRLHLYMKFRLKQWSIKKTVWVKNATRMMTKLKFLLVNTLLINWNKGVKFSRTIRMISKTLNVKKSIFNQVYNILSEINSNYKKERLKTLIQEFEHIKIKKLKTNNSENEINENIDDKKEESKEDRKEDKKEENKKENKIESKEEKGDSFNIIGDKNTINLIEWNKNDNNKDKLRKFKELIKYKVDHWQP